MKKLLLILIAFIFQKPVIAVNVQYMNLTVKNAPISIALADEPVVTYSGDELQVSTPRETFNIKVAELQSWTFSAVATAINKSRMAEPQYSLGYVALGQLTPGSKAEIRDVSGKLVRSEIVDELGSVRLEYGTLPKGVYLIKTSTCTFKITNK